MKLFGNGLAMGLLLCIGNIASADVSVSIDRGNMTVEETFVLTLKSTAGEDLTNTNFIALNEDFNALKSRRESNISIVNGKRTSTRELHITLAPKRAGKLRIPALIVDGVQTSSIAIMVREAGTEVDTTDEVLVEAEVTTRRAYVQSQVLFTFRIFRSIALTDMGYTGLELENATIEQLESSNYTRRVNGKDYQVNELRFAIFPQESGTLVIPALEFNARQATQRMGFFDLSNSGKAVRRKTRSIAIEVLPIPDEFPSAPWLPTSELVISEDWSSPPESLSVGDSATRTITLKATGLNGAQLPPIESSAMEGIKIYPDQPKSENISTSSGINALGINSAAWVITRDGDYEIPELRIPWWDTDDNKLRYATIPARRLSIAAAAPVASQGLATTVAPASVTQLEAATLTTPPNNPWQWATVATLLGWLLTTLLLLRRRGSGHSDTPPKEADGKPEARVFRELLRACQKSEADRARALLREWLGQLVPGNKAPTAAAMQQLFDEEQLAESVQQLEQSLYAAAGQTWQGKELAQLLTKWRKGYLKDKKSRREPSLPPLYSSQV